MSRSDLTVMAVGFVAVLAHVSIFLCGRRVPRWTMMLATALGLGLSCWVLALSALALWNPVSIANWGPVESLRHPVLFIAGLAFMSVGGANWLGRAWDLRHRGGWAVFVRGVLGLIHLALAVALLVAGMVLLLGHMGDPGPKEFQQRYGSRKACVACTKAAPLSATPAHESASRTPGGARN